MRIVSEISLGDFNAWSGAKRTMEDLERLDLMDEAESYIEEMFDRLIDELDRLIDELEEH